MVSDAEEQNDFLTCTNIFSKYITDYVNATITTEQADTSYCTSISNILPDSSEFTETCKQIANFIKHSTDTSSTDKIDEPCIYLNYKLNAEVYKIKNDHENTSSIFDNFKREYEKHLDFLKKCNKNIKHIDKETFGNLEKIYELYHNLNIFITNSKSAENCKDLDNAAQLYENHMSSCRKSSDNDFCRALHNFHLRCFSYIGDVTSNCPEVSKTSLFKLGSHEFSEDIDTDDAASDEEDDDDIDDFGSASPHNFLIAFAIIPFGSWLRPHIRKGKRNLNMLYQKALNLFNKNRHEELNSPNSIFNMQYYSSQND
ncbi:PIR Superfamily Protein [Plasmodium ovale wallikeri]|uniref:PIR Superfamily Protein n=1 Tax=Plasmodium ovale wallikeri TaxID=864142 RepID=A0A1A9AJ92_PLAOA|nr:PIR Superfamily Protein [Plasmodium ovale wallikeri]SBT56269.1 PIR Superfamily Protein [Plasmodium ovale wallikeri]